MVIKYSAKFLGIIYSKTNIVSHCKSSVVNLNILYVTSSSKTVHRLRDATFNYHSSIPI